MTSHRTRRVADLLRALVAERMARDVHDPRLRGVGITRVEVTPDLRLATLYYSLYAGGQAEREAAARALAGARGYLRREIGQRIRLRVTPELRFLPDRALEHAARVDQVLHEIGREEGRRGPAGDEEE